jgi:hypothetical protein
MLTLVIAYAGAAVADVVETMASALTQSVSRAIFMALPL